MARPHDDALVLERAARLPDARVLVVGDAMLDRYWFGAVERISPEAPVPVVQVQQRQERPGGAANVALNVRALGARTTLLTVAGEDDEARALEHLLHGHGVTARLGRDAGGRTTVKLRVVGRAQQLLRLDFEAPPSAAALDRLAADVDGALAVHDGLLLSDYGKGALARVQPMIARARAAGLPVLVDPKGLDWQRYAGATAVTPNRHELALVAGAWSDEAGLERRAQALRRELRLDAVLVTRSEEGMTLFDAQGRLHHAAQARQVYDVTGAGDTVIATLTALVAAGFALRDAVPLANRAAGLVVSRFGTASVSAGELFGHGGDAGDVP